MALAVIDWDALLTVIWSSLIGGIGVTAAYGVAILGGVRALELGRNGRVGVAVFYGVLGALGLAAVAAAIVFGILVITDN